MIPRWGCGQGWVQMSRSREPGQCCQGLGGKLSRGGALGPQSPLPWGRQLSATSVYPPAISSASEMAFIPPSPPLYWAVLMKTPEMLRQRLVPQLSFLRCCSSGIPPESSPPPRLPSAGWVGSCPPPAEGAVFTACFP